MTVIILVLMLVIAVKVLKALTSLWAKVFGFTAFTFLALIIAVFAMIL